MYINRQQVEIDSGIYEPLPPVNSDDSDDSDNSWITIEAENVELAIEPNFWGHNFDDSDDSDNLDNFWTYIPRNLNDRLVDYERDLWVLKLAMAILMALILADLFLGFYGLYSR